MTEPDLRSERTVTDQSALRPADASADAGASRWSRLKNEWGQRLEPGQQAVVLAWSSFTATFVGVRALTHWIRGGHGPSGGGLSVGGRHFHHYNIGIGLLAAIGAIALRGHEKHLRHPVTAVALRLRACPRR